MIRGIGTETRCWNGEGFRGEAAGVIPIPMGQDSPSTLLTFLLTLLCTSSYVSRLIWAFPFCLSLGFIHCSVMPLTLPLISRYYDNHLAYCAIIACTGPEFIYLHLSGSVISLCLPNLSFVISCAKLFTPC